MEMMTPGRLGESTGRCFMRGGDERHWIGRDDFGAGCDCWDEVDVTAYADSACGYPYERGLYAVYR